MNSDEFFEMYALMCSRISKPIRLKILHFIGDKKVCVSDIQKYLGIELTFYFMHAFSSTVEGPNPMEAGRQLIELEMSQMEFGLEFSF
ncbi:MAG: hypothetical protein GY757_21270 [bacterium]|nr:hypothetical protein [bacterium]